MTRTRVSQLSSDEPLRTRTANAPTTFTVAPSGTGVGAALLAISASDQNNTSTIAVSVDGTAAYISASHAGTGVDRPLLIYAGQVERIRVATSGAVIVNNGQVGFGSSVAALSVYGGGATWSTSMLGIATSGSSYGLFVQAGYTNSDSVMSLVNRANTVSTLVVRGDNTLSINNGSASGVVSAQALTVNGFQQAYTVGVYGVGISGASYGLQVAAAYDGSNQVLYCTNRAQTFNMLQLAGNGTVVFNATNSAQGGAPICVTAYGYAQNYAQSIYGYNNATAGYSHGLQIVAGFSASENPLIVYNRNSSVNLFQLAGDGHIYVNAGANLTTTGTVLTLYGCNNNYSTMFYASPTLGQSYGSIVYGGSNTSDTARATYNRAGNIVFENVRGDGYITLSAGVSPFTAGGAVQNGWTYSLSTPNVANASGQVIAQSHPTYSSVNAKRNLQPIEGALSLVSKLRGQRYEHHHAFVRVVDASKGAAGHEVEHVYTPSVGFMMEDVMQHIPEVVSRNGHGQAMGLDYGRLVSVLWEAVNELQREVQDLKQQKQAA
jgi:hypothetical protein